MKRKIFLCTLLAVLVVGLLAACAAPTPTTTPTTPGSTKPVPTTTVTVTATPKPTTPAAQVFNWKASTWAVRGVASFAQQENQMKLIEKASGGRIKITFYGEGEVAKQADIYDAVSKGILDMAQNLGATNMNLQPAITFDSGVPFCYGSDQDWMAVNFEWGVNQVLDGVYKKHNTYRIPYNPLGSTTVTFETNFLLKTAADFQGKKVRLIGLTGDIVKEAGASIVFLSSSDIYSALERKLIDGCTYGPLYLATSMGLHEVSKYILWPGILGGNQGSWTVNLDSWNKLPDDLKQIVYSVCQQPYINPTSVKYEPKSWGTPAYSYLEDKNLINTEILPKGKIVTAWTPEANAGMIPYVLKVFEKYSAQDPDFAKIVDLYQSYWKFAGFLK